MITESWPCACASWIRPAPWWPLRAPAWVCQRRANRRDRPLRPVTRW